MDEIRLIKPSAAYAEDIMLLREELIQANGGVFEKDICVDGDFIKRYWITL